jgi:hypothetical protein
MLAKTEGWQKKAARFAAGTAITILAHGCAATVEDSDSELVATQEELRRPVDEGAIEEPAEPLVTRAPTTRSTERLLVASESNRYLVADSSLDFVAAEDVRSEPISDGSGLQVGVRLIARDNSELPVRCGCKYGCSEFTSEDRIGCIMLTKPTGAFSCVGECYGIGCGGCIPIATGPYFPESNGSKLPLDTPPGPEPTFAP